MPFVSSVRGTFGATSENRGVSNPGSIAELVRQNPNSTALPTGGTITTSGGYRIHTFTTQGANTFSTVNFNASITAEYVVLASGGGGSTSHGGGAGAGGAVYVASNVLTSASYPVYVGVTSPRSTSTAQRNGDNSTFNGITALGGGGGGYSEGFNGGCGSGSGHARTVAGVATQASGGYGSTGGVGYGFNGGHVTGGNHSAGGGGGIGSAGVNGIANSTHGPGGNGRIFTMIQATAVGGGGGGGAHSGAPGGPGLGTDGGGNGSPETVGGVDASRYGAGGGGGGHSQASWGGGAGYQGIVVIRYAI